MSDFVESEAEEESEEEFNEDGEVIPKSTKKFVEEDDGKPAWFYSTVCMFICRHLDVLYQHTPEWEEMHVSVAESFHILKQVAKPIIGFCEPNSAFYKSWCMPQ